ncbi:PilZ domain-containing protein [Salinisphaera hydrothermalis]
MDAVFAEILEFHDRERVVRTLQLIEGQSRTLTLSEPGGDWTLPAARLWLEDDASTVVLEASEPQWATIDLPDSGLALTATAERETLRFDGIAPVVASDTTPPDRRRFHIPERLRVENKRAGVRLPFLKGMSARFEARGRNGKTDLVARVIDLSIGGCQIELPVAAALTLDIGGTALDIAIEFPNGDRLEASAVARYVRILGTGGMARVGLALEALGDERRQQLWLWLHEIEMEIALRRGERSAARESGGLFRPRGARDAPVGRMLPPSPAAQITPMHKSLLVVARNLSHAALAVRTDEPLPAASMLAGAERLCSLLLEDRQGFLFTLASMTEQPPLIQHSLAFAGRLADLVVAEPEIDLRPRDIALAALLHDLQVVRRVQYPAATLADVRREPAVRSGQHIPAMRDRLCTQPELDTTAIRCMFAGLGATGESIDDTHMQMVQAARVVKAVDVRVRGYHGRPPITAFDACREIYRDQEGFSDYWVRRYIQRQGPYPIGTMVRYANGFRAQVVSLDERGQPTGVRVVRNLKAPGHQRLNLVLDGVDLHQLGKLEHAMAYEPHELYAPLAV